MSQQATLVEMEDSKTTLETVNHVLLNVQNVFQQLSALPAQLDITSTEKIVSRRLDNFNH